ncbi:ABC transporter ATP-binding protein [Streptomyces sp. NPDC088785]|uniref:ABC transporter ATP-binding protein n=1 Tax=Streptomyces sp. NPDC088785 TaxID=3365897 RepID=UPI003807A9D1
MSSPTDASPPAGLRTEPHDGAPPSTATKDIRSRLVRRLPLTLALGALAALGRVAVPVVAQRVTDLASAPGSHDLTEPLQLVVLGTLVLAASTLCACLMARRMYGDAEDALAVVRVAMLEHVHRLAPLDRSRYRRGALVARMTNDVDQISNFMQRGGAMVLVGLAQLVLAVVLMFVYSWQLALIVVACMAPLPALLPLLQRRLAAVFVTIQGRLGTVVGLIGEIVAGSVVVRVFGAQKMLQQRIDDAVDDHYRSQMQGQRLAAVAYLTGEAVVGLISATVLAAGVYLGAAGRVTIGELAAFLFLTTLFIHPLQLSAEILNEFQNALAASRRIRHLLAHEPTMRDPRDAATPLPEGPLGVELSGVDFHYPDGPQVLHGVELTLKPGRSLAVVGRTGSGKSTIVSMLARMADPTHGEVTLGGVPLNRIPPEQLRTAVQLVPQDGHLFNATIAENVRYARPELTDAHVHEVFADLGLADWLDALPQGVGTQVGPGGSSLSAGERQLVAFARAHAAAPALLVLDEATSLLDPLTEARMAYAVDRMARTRTLVAVAHRMSTAERTDEVVVMDGGRIVQRGPHARLRKEEGPYRALHQAWTARMHADPS